MRRLLSALSAVLVFPLLVWAALPFTDSFTGTNGTALGTYSASWTVPKVAGNIEIQSNAVQSKVAAVYPYNVGTAYNNSNTYNNDQYATVTLTFTGAPDESAGPAIRLDSTGAGYFASYNEVNGQACIGISLDQGVNGLSSVNLGCDGTDYNTGDTLTIKAVGTTISILKNGVQTTSLTDTNYTTGNAGVVGIGTQTTMLIDNFEGGNVSASGPDVTHFYKRRFQ